MSEPATNGALPGATGDRPAHGTPGQYDENGVDLSLIRANMRLTPDERARRAERARRPRCGSSRLAEIKRHLARPKDRESLLQLEAIKRLRAEEGLR